MKKITGYIMKGQAFSKTDAETATRNSLRGAIEHIAKIFTRKDNMYDATWRTHIGHNLQPIFNKANNVKTSTKKLPVTKLDEIYTDEVGDCYNTVGNIWFKAKPENKMAFQTETIARRKCGEFLEPALLKLKKVVIQGLLRKTVNPATPRTASKDELVIRKEDIETANYLAKRLADATVEARKEAMKALK